MPFAGLDAAHPVLLPDGTHPHPGNPSYLRRAYRYLLWIEVGESTAMPRPTIRPPTGSAQLAPYTYPFPAPRSWGSPKIGPPLPFPLAPKKKIPGRWPWAPFSREKTASADHRHDGPFDLILRHLGGGMPEGRPSLPGSGPRHGDRP